MSLAKVDESETEKKRTGAPGQLLQMMRSGRSFSGRERHCCFLNQGDGRFANVSAVSGLDWKDDGRALAVTDWDRDGDLDLWISNRNAPQLRFLRNDLQAQRSWLALRLRGDGETTNRDAIGARIEVVLPGGTPSVETVRAGEGFLAQSSKWVHFGLGAEKAIEEVVVHWPGGGEEIFASVEPGARYELVQGTGRARRVEVDSPPRMEARPLELPPSTSKARIPLVWLLPFSRVWHLPPGETNPVARRSGGGRALLVNLWASWCAPCIAELREFRERAADLRAAGVDVLALSVDGLDGSGEVADAAAAARALDGFPFEHGRATPLLLQLLRTLYAAQFRTNLDLVVPLSFLIDGKGRLSVIYKGPVGVDRLLADLEHSQRSRPERLASAAGIPGVTLSDERVVGVAVHMELEARLGLARGMVVNQQLEEGLVHYRAALAMAPDSVEARMGTGALLLRMGRPKKAIVHLRRAVELDPESADGLAMLGAALIALRDPAGARNHLQRALELDPEHGAARAQMERLRSLAQPRRATEERGPRADPGGN